MISQKIKQVKIGCSEALIIMAFIVLAVWGYLKKIDVEINAAYTKGVITGTHKGAKGSIYLDFEFYAGSEKVVSWSSLFTGWKIGDTILIKFNRNNPHNNNIIKKIPEGISLE